MKSIDLNLWTSSLKWVSTLMSQPEQTWTEWLWHRITTINVVCIIVALIGLVSAIILSRRAINCYIFNTKSVIGKNTISIPPPEMYHQHMCIKDWLENFESYAFTCNLVNGTEKARMILARLDTHCIRMVRESLSMEDMNNLKKVREKLLDLFDVTTAEDNDHVKNFSDTVQLPGENVSQFFAVLKSKAKLAFSDQTKPQFDKLLITQFMKGLRSIHIRSKIVVEKTDATTIEQLVEQAKKLEKALLEAGDEEN